MMTTTLQRKQTTPASAPTTFTFADGRAVNRLGFGTMRLTGQPGNFGPYADWHQGIALLREAFGLGVEVFDSARSYGPLDADRIVGEALGDTDAFLATKGGVDKPEPGRITVDGSPATLDREIDEALANLRRDTIDLFQLHRVDPNTPIEQSVAAMDAARRDGRVARLGLSNVDLPTLERAMTVAHIDSVQNRLNMSETDDAELLDFTTKHGIAYLPYGPLGANPMQQGAKLDPVDALEWLLRRAPNIVAIPGTTKLEHMRANAAVVDRLHA